MYAEFWVLVTETMLFLKQWSINKFVSYRVTKKPPIRSHKVEAIQRIVSNSHATW